MSRIRTTLDSVTKAVGSTDLISKFSRFKPASVTVDSPHVGKALAKKETLASNNAATVLPPENAMKEEEEEGERTIEEKEADKQCQLSREKPFVATVNSTSAVVSAANASAPDSTSTVAKQTMQLFHPAALSTNMDETYKTLAQHINSYFGTSTQVEEDQNTPVQQHKGQERLVSEPFLSTVCQASRDHVPVLSPVAEPPNTSGPPPPLSNFNPSVLTPASDVPATESASQSIPAPAPSPKKGFTHYLSYPRPSVQAFVGSYIAPLVPKFRGDTKSMAAEKDKPVAVEEPTVENAGEKTESEEEKVKQHLLTQREKVRWRHVGDTVNF